MSDGAPRAHGSLFVVSTPIGNLKDITLRAIEVLKSVDLIVCEDTRRSKGLLRHYGIAKPLTPLFQGKEERKSGMLVQRLLEGQDIALISSAGTPNLSDPGYRLIAGAHERGIPVVTVPGPSAVVSALSVSGLPTDRFIFEGFLPAKRAARRKRMSAWKGEGRTIVYYESPHRMVRSLEDLCETLGNVDIVLARELTKKFEEVRREKVKDALKRLREREPVGEFVVLIRQTSDVSG